MKTRRVESGSTHLNVTYGKRFLYQYYNYWTALYASFLLVLHIRRVSSRPRKSPSAKLFYRQPYCNVLKAIRQATYIIIRVTSSSLRFPGIRTIRPKRHSFKSVFWQSHLKLN